MGKIYGMFEHSNFFPSLKYVFFFLLNGWQSIIQESNVLVQLELSSKIEQSVFSNRLKQLRIR